MVDLSPREEAALAVVQTHLGVTVTPHDDQSQPGMYDLEVVYEDGRRGAVEVTAAEHQGLAADAAALQKDPILRDERLTQGWLALLMPHASVKLARARLPDLLVQVERAGLTELSRAQVRSWEEYEEQEWLRDLLDEAGVDHVRAGAMHPGVVGVLGAIRSAWLSTDPEVVVAFVERFVKSRPSDVRKLGRSGADERHLFIWGARTPRTGPR